MADLYFKENWPSVIVHESILGTLFTGRLVEKAKVGDYDAVVPQITEGPSSQVNHFRIDDEDP